MGALVECVNCGQYSDLGDCCYDCAGRECDRCDKQMSIDEEITPHDVFGEDYYDKPECSEFSDGAYNLCSDCITPAEATCWRSQSFISWINPRKNHADRQNL